MQFVCKHMHIETGRQAKLLKMVDREDEPTIVCVVVLWFWNALTGFADAVVRWLAYVVSYVYDASRYYEIRIAVLGMRNAGKSTFVMALQQIERGDAGVGVPPESRDTVPTLKTQVTNVVLQRHGLGVVGMGLRGAWEGPDGPNGKHVNETEVRTYGTVNSGGEEEEVEEEDHDGAEPNADQGTSFDVLSNYIRSMKSNKTLQSTKSLKSLKSSHKDQGGSSPLLGEPDDASPVEETSLLKGVRTREKVVVKVSDLSGQAKHVHVWPEYLAEAKSDCIVYVLDLSDSLTLRESRDKLRELLQYNNAHDRLPFLVVGNKADLVDWKTAFADPRSSARAAGGASVHRAFGFDGDQRSRHQRQLVAWLGLQTKGDCSTGVVLSGVPPAELQFEVAVFVVSVLHEDVAPVLAWALGAGGENWAGGVL